MIRFTHVFWGFREHCVLFSNAFQAVVISSTVFFVSALHLRVAISMYKWYRDRHSNAETVLLFMQVQSCDGHVRCSLFLLLLSLLSSSLYVCSCAMCLKYSFLLWLFLCSLLVTE